MTTTQKNSCQWLPIAFILLQSTLYGFGDPISKAAYEVVPLYALLSARYTIAFLFLMAIFGKRVVRGLKACSVRDWLLPSLCIAGGYIATNIAIVFTTATATAFLRSLSTVMTPLLALVVFRKKFSWKHIPILVMVIVGLYLLCGRGGLTGFGIGEIFGLLSALLLAGSLVFGEKALDKVDPVALTTVQTAMSVVLTTLCAFLLEGGIHLETAGTTEWLIIVYLAILCTVAGYLLQNAALRSISSRVVALLQCTGPVMTAFFSFLILGERLNLAGLVGAAILLACVVAETLMADDEKNKE
ncbi:MAG: DMT family transporter [Ruminiclostridium sp.]|nr:DMT family transporter [Ruminiclostridium sp.]